MILRVLGVSLIGLTLAGCVNDSSLSGDVYSASEAKQVQNVTYGTVVNARPVQIQGNSSTIFLLLVQRYELWPLMPYNLAITDAPTGRFW